ncbi:unnamed protein product, partial [Prorocentrum cordatum]
DWYNYDIYARVCMLYGSCHFLYAVTYYSIGTTICELRGFWIMWSLPMLFMTAQDLLEARKRHEQFPSYDELERGAEGAAGEGQLAWLLEPAASPARFLREAWERAALHVPSSPARRRWAEAALRPGGAREGEGAEGPKGPEGCLRGLLGGGGGGVAEGALLVRAAGRDGLDERHGGGDGAAALGAEELLEGLAQGYTLLLPRAEGAFPRLGRLVAALGAEMGLVGNCALYWTPQVGRQCCALLGPVPLRRPLRLRCAAAGLQALAPARRRSCARGAPAIGREGGGRRGRRAGPPSA